MRRPTMRWATAAPRRTRPSLVLGQTAASLFVLFCAAGCTPELPEKDSRGAVLYSERCGTCHRLYAPNLMTAATWKVMVDRMQGEMRRRGFPPLDAEEKATLTRYLERFAFDAASGPGDTQKGGAP